MVKSLDAGHKNLGREEEGRNWWGKQLRRALGRTPSNQEQSENQAAGPREEKAHVSQPSLWAQVDKFHSFLGSFLSLQHTFVPFHVFPPCWCLSFPYFIYTYLSVIGRWLSLYIEWNSLLIAGQAFTSASNWLFTLVVSFSEWCFFQNTPQTCEHILPHFQSIKPPNLVLQQTTLFWAPLLRAFSVA